MLENKNIIKKLFGLNAYSSVLERNVEKQQQLIYLYKSSSPFKTFKTMFFQLTSVLKPSHIHS